MTLEILKFCLQEGFWHFIGCLLVLGLICGTWIAMVQAVVTPFIRNKVKERPVITRQEILSVIDDQEMTTQDKITWIQEKTK